ncbi:MAG: hypothetical protein JW969_13960 [Spirochaetales bacterium]|nr:hypothetical protein [Spirochaetales bacterium]
MRKCLSIIIFTAVLSVVLFFFSCEPPSPAAPTIAGEAIFGIPPSITGTSMKGTKAITAETRSLVNEFFDYARTQIYVANAWADSVKLLILSLEASGVFTYGSNWEGVVTDGSFAGDKARWTVNGGDAYTLEWWKNQGVDSYEKYIVLDLTHYTKVDNVITVRGTIYVCADSDPANSTPWTDYNKNARWVVIQFDSAKQDLSNKRWMKISVAGFQHNLLDPSQPPISDSSDYQECIFEATKDADGIVELKGATSVPGIDLLNYLGEYEYRYYMYKAKGNSSQATMSLALPLDTAYAAAGATPDNIFGDNESIIGGVVTEYVADLLRADGAIGGTTGWVILDGLGFTASRPYENTTPTPLTGSIKTNLTIAYGLYPDNEDLENLNYVMNVINPVYLTASTYDSFGPVVPSGFYSASELPELTVQKSDLDGLAVYLDNTANTFDPDEAPPGIP